MVIGRIVNKIVQSLPSWEITKYYGRVCLFQMQCLKYRIQTSETWFRFRCKFTPNRLRDEAEREDLSDQREIEKSESISNSFMQHLRSRSRSKKTKSKSQEASPIRAEQKKKGLFKIFSRGSDNKLKEISCLVPVKEPNKKSKKNT